MTDSPFTKRAPIWDQQFTIGACFLFNKDHRQTQAYRLMRRSAPGFLAAVIVSNIHVYITFYAFGAGRVSRSYHSFSRSVMHLDDHGMQMYQHYYQYIGNVGNYNRLYHRFNYSSTTVDSYLCLMFAQQVEARY